MERFAQVDASVGRLWEGLCSYAGMSASGSVMPMAKTAHEDEEEALFQHYLEEEGLLKPWQMLDDWDGRF